MNGKGLAIGTNVGHRDSRDHECYQETLDAHYHKGGLYHQDPLAHYPTLKKTDGL